MKKLTFVLTAVVLGVLLTLPAFAFGPRGGNGPGGFHRGNCPGGDRDYYSDTMFKKLNLTDEQKTKIEDLITAREKEIRPMREKMFDKSVQLRRLWLNENPDKDKILALQKETRTLRDKMEDKATTLRFEIRKILTPEQQTKLANFGWGRGPGFGPRVGMRGQGCSGHDGFGPGMEMF